MFRTAALFFLIAVMPAAISAREQITDTRFANARFEAATLIAMQAVGDKTDQKSAYLWVYQSGLGSALKKREPNAEEVGELRRLCRNMHKAGKRLAKGGFDGYGIEFANGTGDTSKLSPSRRVVFFFWDGGACKSKPSRGKIGK
ncbi:MAG: hypothetical protein AAGF53_15025 [Pseudomonadota bacterium]